ncbi:MAG: DUF924 family protein [Pseudomonadota bacterium]
MNEPLSPQTVLDFWFRELAPPAWWKVDPELDAAMRRRFGALHRAAARGELWSWRDTPHGRLAEVIVLDQFSRNLFRGTAAAFAQDPLALALAQEAIRAGTPAALDVPGRMFLYMPFMHSESPAMHEEALRLFAEPGLEYNLDFERRHKAIIDRFGRYPHRNAALGRESTPEETEFLKQPGSSF